MDAIETAAYSKEAAWHRLGTVLNDFMDTKTAFVQSGLDWPNGVEKRPLYTSLQRHNPNAIVNQMSYQAYNLIPDKFAVVRNMDNAIMGVVGPDYQVIQNVQMFNFLDALTTGEHKVAKWESAGSLRGGKQVWALLNLVESDIIVGKNDRVLPYLLITNAHDGSAACRVIPTTVRVVCWNTLNVAVAGQFSDLVVTIRHTGDTERKLEEAKLILAEAGERFGAFAIMANTMRETEVKQDSFAEIIETLFPAPNPEDVTQSKLTRIKNNRDLFANAVKEEVLLLGPGNPLDYWTLLNGITRYADHAKQVNKGSRSIDEARFESNMLGGGDKFKQEATKVLLQAAKEQ